MAVDDGRSAKGAMKALRAIDEALARDMRRRLDVGKNTRIVAVIAQFDDLAAAAAARADAMAGLLSLSDIDSSEQLDSLRATLAESLFRCGLAKASAGLLLEALRPDTDCRLVLMRDSAESEEVAALAGAKERARILNMFLLGV